ncbi:cytochrome c maturation protein CcmE domain-containing protein [Arcticibacterium luteifluviistationis]|uniref:Cytochrome C biogenesis protein n=1 Tax=Arcticibacterium luteifluviistationis TaxID=1784714 RepID=A0A2Z4GAM6_9BACT|nr:cytochrome c maturation protein CcmE [Arcticibacterium luteifluviistationis]AWV98322.1 cytochrome C biogenesis protein [Arcticibacterium luteifluviistationis]
MKKSHIIALGVIAVAIVMIISTVGDASTYSDFNQAKKLAESGSSTSVHVVGELKKDGAGTIEGMVYQPSVDPNKFEFMMVDSMNFESRVVYMKAKPQDMERSEKVVVVGKMNLEKDYFLAEQILLKCPSKYNNGDLDAKSQTASR